MKISIETMGESFTEEQLLKLMDAIEAVVVREAPYALIEATRDYETVERGALVSRNAWRQQIATGATNMGYYEWEKEEAHRTALKNVLERAQVMLKNCEVTPEQVARYSEMVSVVDAAAIYSMGEWMAERGEPYREIYSSRVSGEHPVYTRKRFEGDSHPIQRVMLPRAYDAWVQRQIDAETADQ